MNVKHLLIAMHMSAFLFQLNIVTCIFVTALVPLFPLFLNFQGKPLPFNKHIRGRLYTH
jgi:hypothetical protein